MVEGRVEREDRSEASRSRIDDAIRVEGARELASKGAGGQESRGWGLSSQRARALSRGERGQRTAGVEARGGEWGAHRHVGMGAGR